MALENPAPLDMETAVRCTRCSKLLKTANGDAHRIGVYQGSVCTEVICCGCSSNEKLANWHSTGELKTPLVLEAQSAVTYHDEFKDLSRLRPEYAELYRTHIETYRLVYKLYMEVDDAARMAEIAVWFGRPDRADKATVDASHKFAQQWLPSRHNDGVEQSFGLDLGPNAVKAYYTASPAAGHSYKNDDFKILMLGSAGRVLVTVSDTRPQSDPLSKFGGANITLIYDDSSAHPRGGIQSHVGTQKELLGLIEAYRSPEVKFQPDEDVSIF